MSRWRCCAIRTSVDAFLRDGHEIASHGWRWISYQAVDESFERDHLERAVDAIRRLTGKPPEGWYTGRDSPNTRRLVVEHGGFVYDADSYADDLPYWVEVETARGATPHLVVPYTLDTNDMRFATPQGFNSGDQFYSYLKDAFDTLYAEGDPAGPDAPKMLSIGLHCRIVGPAGAACVARAVPRLRALARPRMVRATHRHRAALDRNASFRAQPMTLSEINALDPAGFVAALGASSSIRRGSRSVLTTLARSRASMRCTKRCCVSCNLRVAASSWR